MSALLRRWESRPIVSLYADRSPRRNGLPPYIPRYLPPLLRRPFGRLETREARRLETARSTGAPRIALVDSPSARPSRYCVRRETGIPTYTRADHCQDRPVR